ncbi:MAG: hypothetical protein KC502_05260 [Myxococcales bacterium]|nr:hypothetical protein [Myxococcales bacterium]
MRSSDRTLWYSFRDKDKWVTEAIDKVPPHRVGMHLALGLQSGQPVVAFADAIDGGISIARRSQGWSLSSLPAPPTQPDTGVSMGRGLAMSGRGGALALATYDAVGGDLILASHAASGWQSARFAGVDSTTGADLGDVGTPCSLARDVGGELIVAWRHRSANEVWVARSSGGEIVRRRVSAGNYQLPGRNVTRRRVVGTALDVVVRSDGRIAVALQDASRARIVVAVETVSGDFKRYEVPATGSPQIRPKLLARVDGSVVVSWLDLRSDGAGRLATWILNITGETP